MQYVLSELRDSLPPTVPSGKVLKCLSKETSNSDNEEENNEEVVTNAAREKSFFARALFVRNKCQRALKRNVKKRDKLRTQFMQEQHRIMGAKHVENIDLASSKNAKFTITTFEKLREEHEKMLEKGK